MEEELLGSIRQSPDDFVWSEPHQVELIKNDEDNNLGVKVRTIQGRINPDKTYTLITQVRPQCSEQRREQLNAGYRIEAGNGVDVTRMNQDQVLRTLTSYKDGVMRLLVSYPLRLKDNIPGAAVDNDPDKVGPMEFPDNNCSSSLDNQVSTLVKANLERCKSGESERSVSLKSTSDSEQQRPAETGANAHKKGSGDSAGNPTCPARKDRRLVNSVTSKTVYQKLHNMDSGDSGDREVGGRVLSRQAMKQFSNDPCSSPSHSSQSLPIIPVSSQSSPTRAASSPRPPMQRAVSLSSPDELYDITLEEPHLIKWNAPSQGIDIERDVDGKLGFRYKEVQNKEDPREVFTLVKEVFPNSPALGSLQKGDRILSVNGQHLQDTRKGINTASIVNRSEGETVRIIIQRPRGLRERKPDTVNAADIKLDWPAERKSSGVARSELQARPHQRISTSRSPSREQQNNTGVMTSGGEGKKRPHSGSSTSQGTATSQSYNSRPIHVHEVTDQLGSPPQWSAPVNRPNYLPCDVLYSNMQAAAPPNGLHSTYHMTGRDPGQLDSMDNPMLVTVNADTRLDITVRPTNPVANGLNNSKKTCSLQLNITRSPHGSPAHTPTADGGGGVATALPIPASTSTPTPNGCTCLALWNSPLKDTFKKINRKSKEEAGSGYDNHLDPRDVNCNNLNPMNSGDTCNDAERTCVNQNVHQNGNKPCTYGDNGNDNGPTKDMYELRPIRVSLDTHIKSVPCGLFILICQHMNINMVLHGRDWRGLADEMGKSMQDILVLEMEDDPCKALLTDWGSSSQATLGRLVDILLRLAREDVVDVIKNYISSH